MMKILLTAFDPFGGEDVNSALEAVALVPDRVAGAVVVKLTVPTVFGLSVRKVLEAVETHRPDAVLCVGQAAGRASLALERLAVNLDDAATPDNEGHRPVDQPIDVDGPPAYFATLPVKAMVAAIRQAGLPAALSNSAGTFVCNHLMYGVLNAAAKSALPMKAGFMHVPLTTRQAAGRDSPPPSMSVGDMARGIEAALAAVLQHLKGEMV